MLRNAPCPEGSLAYLTLTDARGLDFIHRRCKLIVGNLDYPLTIYFDFCA